MSEEATPIAEPKNLLYAHPQFRDWLIGWTEQHGAKMYARMYDHQLSRVGHDRRNHRWYGISRQYDELWENIALMQNLLSMGNEVASASYFHMEEDETNDLWRMQNRKAQDAEKRVEDLNNHFGEITHDYLELERVVFDRPWLLSSEEWQRIPAAMVILGRQMNEKIQQAKKGELCFGEDDKAKVLQFIDQVILPRCDALTAALGDEFSRLPPLIPLSPLPIIEGKKQAVPLASNDNGRQVDPSPHH